MSTGSLGFRPLFELEIELFAPVSLLGSSAEARPSTSPAVPELRVVPFRSGSFVGPEVRGQVLAGGTDWQELGPDGTLDIHARYLLETEQGERVEVRSDGLRTAAPEVLALLASGQRVAPELVYFRTAIRLRTAAPRLSHWNRMLAFSRGDRRAESVHLTVFELL